jgi:hypothetical protein
MKIATKSPLESAPEQGRKMAASKSDLCLRDAQHYVSNYPAHAMYGGVQHKTYPENQLASIVLTHGLADREVPEEGHEKAKVRCDHKAQVPEQVPVLIVLFVQLLRASRMIKKFRDFNVVGVARVVTVARVTKAPKAFRVLIAVSNAVRISEDIRLL